MKNDHPEPCPRERDAAEDAALFGFQLPEEGWMSQFSHLCAADDLDENGVVRWKAWLESRPAGLIGADE